MTTIYPTVKGYYLSLRKQVDDLEERIEAICREMDLAWRRMSPEERISFELPRQGSDSDWRSQR